jgi:hypothetical protein
MFRKRHNTSSRKPDAPIQPMFSSRLPHAYVAGTARRRCSEPPTDGFLERFRSPALPFADGVLATAARTLKPGLAPTGTPDFRSLLEGLHGRGRPRLGRRRYRRLNGRRRSACRGRRSIFDDSRVCGSRSRCAGFHPRLAVAPAGSSQSPGTSNGWSGRISNQCARNRPYRAEHHGAR